MTEVQSAAKKHLSSVRVCSLISVLASFLSCSFSVWVDVKILLLNLKFDLEWAAVKWELLLDDQFFSESHQILILRTSMILQVVLRSSSEFDSFIKFLRQCSN